MERSDTVKAILVIDMPSKCEECNFHQYGICHAVRKCIVGTPKGLKEKPDWCPLKPMPSKIGMEEALKMPRNGCIADVISSYNACIDEILGDKE